ncbi:MAG: LPS export ABC transporter periplasmic protein LptC [Saprospiraceae bacterium]
MFLIIFTSCENDITEVRKWGHYEDIPTEVGTNVEMLYSDSFQVRVKVFAPRLVRYGGAKVREEFNEGIEVDFIGNNLKTTSRLTAKRATKKTITVKDEKGRTKREPVVIIRDSVVLVSNNGEMMKTDELIWFEHSDKLSSNKFVTIIRPDEVIYGYGFDSDKEFGRWRIRSVTGRFKSDSFKNDFQD